MITVNWASTVNMRILRNGTSWESKSGFLEDTSLSGKTKRRIAHSMEKRVFAVTMRFTLSEYTDFESWYNTVCRKGVYAFTFPRIDAINQNDTPNAIYRFVNGSAPKYSNPSGDLVECAMEWEEVGFIND